MDKLRQECQKMKKRNKIIEYVYLEIPHVDFKIFSCSSLSILSKYFLHKWRQIANLELTILCYLPKIIDQNEIIQKRFQHEIIVKEEAREGVK